MTEAEQQPPEPARESRPAFRDESLPLDQRIRHLLSQLTLREKLSQMHGHAPAVPRLSIRARHGGTEILHGLCGTERATGFPQAIGLGATWNAGLLARIGTAIGDEVRAVHREDPTVGLNVWGPVVNLLRDPRWGRNEEGYSECPVLTSHLAAAMCRGLTDRGGDPDAPAKTAPTMKCFLAYNSESHKTSANVRPRVLREYELGPFRATVGAGLAASVMLGYNDVNGRPNTVSEYIEPVLRRWNRDTVVFSDAWAPTFLAMKIGGYYPDRITAYTAAVKAGLDVFIDQDRDSTLVVETLERALAAGMLDEDDIDTAVSRILRMRFLLGEFDESAENAYAHIDARSVDGPEHRALSAEAAREAVVLLKNDGAALPLKAEGLSRIAVVGPLADVLYQDWYGSEHAYGSSPLKAIRKLLGEDRVTFTPAVDRIRLREASGGGYLTADTSAEGGPLSVRAEQSGPAQIFEVFDWGEGVVCLRSAANGRYLAPRRDGVLCNDRLEPGGWWVPERFALVADGDEVLLRSVAQSRFAALVEPTGPVSTLVTDVGRALRFKVETVVRGAEEAAVAVRDADAAIVFLGNHPLINGREGEDRPSLTLAAGQQAVAEAVVAANPRTTVVLVSSYPLAVSWIAQHAPALLWTCHGGPELGGALADVLFGAYSPAGRLPQTWPRSEEDLGEITDFDIIDGGKTYLYNPRPVLFPFGHGLTYTDFWYDLRLHRLVLCEEDKIGLSVLITNVGPVAGDEVVQVYWRAMNPRYKRPLRQLAGFTRVHLPVGATEPLSFSLPVRDLARWDPVDEAFVVDPGEYEFMLARSATDVVCRAVLTVRAPEPPARDFCARAVAAVAFDESEAFDIVDASLVAGEAVSARRPGAWLRFQDVDLGAGPELIAAEVCRPEDGWAAVEVRLEHPETGPLIAVLPVLGGSADRHAWTTVTAALRPRAGRADLYLVATGALRIRRLRLGADVDDDGAETGTRGSGSASAGERRPGQSAVAGM